MEFPFSIKEIFRKQISKIDSNLLPDRNSLDTRREERFRKLVIKIIDEIGIASSQAQGLQKVITTADFLKKSEDVLYLLTDPKGQKGKGAAIGFIKVGKKKLFLYDLSNKLREKEPLCVLDFYVHESSQRKGYGKLLFEYMLKDQNTKPEKLAINRPSEMCSAFLSKHYNLTKKVPQSNKYVVYEDFFPKPLQFLSFLNKTSSDIREDINEISKRVAFTMEQEEKAKILKVVTKRVQLKEEVSKIKSTLKNSNVLKDDHMFGCGEKPNKNIVGNKNTKPAETSQPKYKPPPIKIDTKCHHSKHTQLW